MQNKIGTSVAPELKARWAKLAPGALPEAAVHEQARRELRSMTPAEVRQTFVDAGICNPDGSLTREYGG